MTDPRALPPYYECNWHYGGPCGCGGGHQARAATGDAQASVYWRQLPLPFGSRDRGAS
jgi:hypothetical protein